MGASAAGGFGGLLQQRPELGGAGGGRGGAREGLLGAACDQAAFTPHVTCGLRCTTSYYDAAVVTCLYAGGVQ